MRSFPTLTSVASASGEQIADESFLLVLAQFAQGVWIEVLVVVVALYIYLWQLKRAPGAKVSKVVESGSRRQQMKHPIKKSCPGVASKVMDSSPKGNESQQVQNLVISLMQKSHMGNASALLEQYQELIKSCGSNLRQHLPDDNNSRSMYLALVGRAVSLPATSTESSANLARRWTSRLLADMRRMGFARTVDFYASVLKMFTNSQMLYEGLWLHDAMMEDGVSPNEMILISLLNVSVSCGEFKKAYIFFEKICERAPPSARTIMTVLRVHSTKKDWQGAANLLDRMESLGASPDNLILNNVLGLCISSGAVDAAQQLLRRWKHIADVISCNILLKGYAQQGNLAKAEELLQDMVANKPEANLISYNTVMDCAVRSMQVLSAGRPSVHGRYSRTTASVDPRETHSFTMISRRPWRLLEQLISRGLQPDRYTCSTLVKGMHLGGCSVSDIDRAVDLLKRIGADALQVNSTSSNGSAGCNARLLEVLFNTLLDACITVRDLDRMSQIFAMMQSFNVSVSAVTYGTLIKAFGHAGRLNRCHEVWKDMREARIQPTIVTYGCYIDACIRNDDNDHAEEIFGSMAGPYGVRPNAVIYTSLIRGFAHARNPRKALEFYRRMQQEGIEATSVTFNSVLDVVARQLSEPTVLQEVFDDMCNANIVPDVVTYSILMKASCSLGNVQNALSLFRQIRSRGLVFDLVAFNTLLLACSKADRISDAEDIFAEMRQAGMTPTHVTTSIMVKMYGKAKMLDKAVAISELFEKEYGQQPNLYVYTCLIQACVQNRQVRRSWEIFNKMIVAGVEPDAITYGTVIHGCVYLNKFQYAMRLVCHAYQRPLPVDMDPDTPFVALAPLMQPVLLQSEVLHVLSSALQRKGHSTLAKELEGIMAVHATAPIQAKHPGNKANQQIRTGNTRF